MIIMVISYIVTYFLNMANKLADEKGILPGGSLNRDNELVIFYVACILYLYKLPCGIVCSGHSPPEVIGSLNFVCY